MDINKLLKIALFFLISLLLMELAVAQAFERTVERRREMLERKIQNSNEYTQEQKYRLIFNLRKYFDGVNRQKAVSAGSEIVRSDLQRERTTIEKCQPCLEEDGTFQE